MHLWEKESDPIQFSNVDSKIREVGLFVNGQLFPLPMLRGNFSTKETYEMYDHLLEALQGVHSPDPPMIVKDDFDAGRSTLFGYNLPQINLRAATFAPSSINRQISVCM